MNCLEEGDTFGDLRVTGATALDKRGRQVIVGWNKRGPTTYVTIRQFARIRSRQIVPTKSGVIFPADQLHFLLQGLHKLEVILKGTDH